MLATLVAAAAAVVVWCERLDLSAMPEVSRFRDDAYYYFAWARSLIAGDGPCVSPGVSTSGVHVGWALVLAGGGAVFGAGAIPVVAHVTGLLLHVATALGLVWCGRRQARWGVIAGLLYGGNPFLLSEAQNGQETALACASLLLLFLVSRRSEALFVVAAGLAVAARSELLAVVVGLALLRNGLTWRAVAVPLVVLAAHAGGNLLLAGRLLPDSAWPMPWLEGQQFAATDPGLVDHVRRFWWYLRPCLLGGPYGMVSPVLGGVLVFVAVRPLLPRRWRALPLLATLAAVGVGAADLEVALVASLLLFIVRGELRSPRAQATFAGLVAIVVLHYVVRHYPRNYYFAPFGVAGVLAWLRLTPARPVLGAIVAVATAVVAAREARQPAEHWPWQQEMSLAGRALRAVVSAGETVGCFNSGIVTWHDGGAVLNLDGVANGAAFAALREHDLDGYLDRQGVRFVLDTPVQFAVSDPWLHASGRHFGPRFDPRRDLREVARFDVPEVDGGRPGTGFFALYWRVGRGEPPSLPATARDLGPLPGGRRCVLWPGRAGVVLSSGPLTGGRRRPLATGSDGVAFVVAFAIDGDDEFGLFEDADTAPVLRLAPR